jgi:hypothetical protein
LPQEPAEQLGVDVSNPSANIDLYRPSSAVFDPDFLASLNGKAITDNHPPGFVTPENFSEYACGHIQNVRKGPHPMEDGEWPVIADLVISKKSLIDKVRNKTARDISLGYDFGIARDGKKIIQCDMVGNHAAVVPKGRAGDLIAIGDAAPQFIAPPADTEAATTKPSTASLTVQKEKTPVTNLIKHLHGLALKAFAVDADPEKVAEAAEALQETPPVEADDKKARDKKARDLEEEEAEDRRARDRKRARDLDIEEDDHDHEPADDRKKARDVEMQEDDHDHETAEDRKRARDRHADDAKRKAMHDALDDLLDREDVEPADDRKRAKDRKVKDADIEELKALLGQFLSEEEAEPEHAADEALEEEPKLDTKALDEALENPAEVEEEEAAEAEDDLGEVLENAGEELEEEEEPEEEVADLKGKDKARAADGAIATLNMLRPFVARCHDAATQRAFNTALAHVSRSSRASTGSYGGFAGAARARDAKLPRNPNHARVGDAANDRIAKLQAAYDESIQGGK